MAAARAGAGKGGGERSPSPAPPTAGERGAAPEAAPPLDAPERQRLALAVRDACRQAVVGAWEEAQSAGLCAEGAWEVAVGALSGLSAADLLAAAAEPAGRDPDARDPDA